MATKREEFIPTRESLLSRIKNWEDRDSWQDFFDTYWRLIYGTARKAGLTDAEAQDIVQETVLSVARNIEGFRYDPAVCSFKNWMLQLTRWRIVNQLKRRQRDPILPTLGPAHSGGPTAGDDTDRTATLERIPDPTGVDLEAVWDEEWENNLLSAALDRVKGKVDPEQLQVFDLYCIEQWPAQKVARTLGISLGRVYLAKHRVGRLLKKEVDSLRLTHAAKSDLHFSATHQVSYER
jgi:RNA polymerase sigma factor (sigma-70 family)